MSILIPAFVRRSPRPSLARHVRRAAAVVFTSSLLALPAAAAHFRGLTITATHDDGTVVGMNADGDRIVGHSNRIPGGNPRREASVWGESAHDLEIVGPAAPPTAVEEYAVGQETSPDGLIRRTIGWSDFSSIALPLRMWMRVENEGAGTDVTSFLPAYPAAGAANVAIDVSRHGHRLGQFSNGGGSQTTFYFDPVSNTTTNIPGIFPTDMDANGQRVVGATILMGLFERAVLWTASTSTMQDLGTLPGGDHSEAVGISPSGKIVVGSSTSAAVPINQSEAFRWHPDLGMRPLLPIADGQPRVSRAWASSDANLIVGEYTNLLGNQRAFIWTPEIGRRDLRQWLLDTYALNSQLAGWILLRAKTVSSDGLVIAGDGINPDGDPQAWVVHLNDENQAKISVRPIGPPTDWELYVECGDFPLSQIAFGLVPAEPFDWNDPFQFADCNNQIGVSAGGSTVTALDCTGASGIGTSIAESSYVILPQEVDNAPLQNVREAAFYFSIDGDGGPNNDLICRPGDPEVLIGSFALFQPYGDLSPVASPYQFGIGRLPGGDFVEDREFRLIREPEAGGFFSTIQPDLQDVDGSEWTVSFDADVAKSRFSFGIILPPEAGSVAFGGCNEALGAYNARGCTSVNELGPHVDYTAVRTLGPSAALFNDFGLRPDTLYVYVEGDLAGAGLFSQINVPGQTAELGRFTFDSGVSGQPAFDPALTYERIDQLPVVRGDIDDWADNDGTSTAYAQQISGFGFEPGPDSDWDTDGWADSFDLCPYVPSTQSDGGTLEQVVPGGGTLPPGTNDGIGLECQCGEAQGDGQVVQPDLETLRAALADPAFAVSMTAADKARCNSVGPVDGDIDPATQLPFDCDINDVFVLLKARAGLPPLLSAPLEFPSCPDVTTP